MSPDKTEVWVRAKGSVSAEEFHKALRDFAERAEALTASRRIIDLTSVTAFEMDFPRMLSLAMRNLAYYQRFGDRVEMLVLAETETAFGVSRMFQQIVDPSPQVDVTIFRSEAELLDHMGSPASVLSEHFAVLDV